MFFFNSSAVSMLICVIFATVTVAYLLSLKSKSPSTKSLIIFFTGSMILNFGFFLANFWLSPAAAYHRFCTIDGAFIAIGMMIQFAYRFPGHTNVLESRIVLIMSIVLCLVTTVEFAFRQMLPNVPQYEFA